MLALLLLGGLAACAGRGDTGDFGEDRVRIGLRIEPARPATGTAQLALTLADPAGAPLDGATVEIEGTMTHAGMRPVAARARGQGEGRYEVEAFTFTMGGDWLLIAHVTLPDGTRARRIFPVDGVGEGAAIRTPPTPGG